MEKRTPHYPLRQVNGQLLAGKVTATLSALRGAAELGLEFADMLDIVTTLAPGDFHKSMTTHADPRVWQDVYRPMTVAGRVYVKLTVVSDVLIVSFKEA